ncbi:MAG: ribosome assembly factor SBDS [Nanoarchaeota archaeon]|nr:ribosome assembly factor SBDS [Nanoarchaeota archaeon]
MKPIKSYDQEPVSFNLAKLKRGGEHFEVVIDPDKIIDYKKGKITEVREVLQVVDVFSDAKRAMIASHDHIKSIFGTSDMLVVAKIILDQGDVQFTQEYRENKRAEKRNKILDIIVRNAVDPRTGFPHPRTRIENAFEEAKIKIDDMKDAEDQVQHIVSALKPILPIKFAMKEIEVIVPPPYATKAYPVIERYGKIISDNWLGNGSFNCVVDLPAGLQNDFFDAINKFTKGEVTIKVLREH